MICLTQTSYAAYIPSSNWITTWSASPQRVWDKNFIFPTNVPNNLENQTIRQLARISLGGENLRIVLSNKYGKEPIYIGQATIAKPKLKDEVEKNTIKTITFNGKSAATILPGASLISDPIHYPTSSLSSLAISLYLPQSTSVKTFHWDGRQTSWIVKGNQAINSSLKFSDPQKDSTTARLLLSAIQIESNHKASTLAVIGDSITDGATASLNKNTRWPDYLANRLKNKNVAVINAGISGARLLSDGMGDNALARLEQDVMQAGVKDAIVLIGINDISWPGTAFAPNEQSPKIETLKSNFLQLIEQLHLRGIRVIGATLPPFKGALPNTPLDNYYNQNKDALRHQLNDWIRYEAHFDDVIDFDKVLKDPTDPARLNMQYDSGDHLHPNDKGNEAMANAVNINLFEQH